MTPDEFTQLIAAQQTQIQALGRELNAAGRETDKRIRRLLRKVRKHEAWRAQNPSKMPLIEGKLTEVSNKIGLLIGLDVRH